MLLERFALFFAQYRLKHVAMCASGGEVGVICPRN